MKIDDDGMTESGRAVYVIAGLIKENDTLRRTNERLLDQRDRLETELEGLRAKLAKKR